MTMLMACWLAALAGQNEVEKALLPVFLYKIPEKLLVFWKHLQQPKKTGNISFAVVLVPNVFNVCDAWDGNDNN